MTDLISFKKSVQNAIHDFFSSLGDVMTTFFHKAQDIIEETYGSNAKLFLQIVSDAVMAAKGAGGTGKEKRDAAIAAIIADLASKGLPIIENAIRFALEGAVANLPKENAN